MGGQSALNKGQMKMLERQMMLRKHRNQIQSASARQYNEARDAVHVGNFPEARAAWRATYRAEQVCDHYYYEAFNKRQNRLDFN